MFSSKLLVFALFSIYFISSSADKENKTFSALFAFGDSILDTGNNNFLITIMKGNFWPYGKDFKFKIPTGRFGNGRVFTDFVAEGLGVKKYVPAFRKLGGVKDKDLKTGVCFASGGSGIDDFTSKTLRVLSREDQIKDFKKYLKKLKKEVKTTKKVKEILSNAVFLISEGNNDLGYYVAPSLIKRVPIKTYTNEMVMWTKEFLQDLYDKGARKFAVLGVMPIGCIPFHRFAFSGVFGWCNFFLNEITKDFNTKLQKSLQSYEFEEDFKDAKFVYVDIYGTLMDIIKNPKAHGFSKGIDACCCMPNAIIPCKNANDHVFFDFAHPTQKAYEIISKPLVYHITKGLA